MTLDPGAAWPYGLALVRVSGVVLTAPVLGSFGVSARVKVFFSMTLAALLYPAASKVAVSGDPLFNALTTVSEFAVGLGLGLAYRWSMVAVESAGEFAGLQMGLGAASTLNPVSGQNSVLTQSLYLFTYLVLFLALEGHHAVLRTLFASYETVPPGAFVFRPAAMESIVQQTASVLILGLRLSACVWVPLLLLSIAVALVSRAFPQANVFSLSYTVSLLMGMALLIYSAPAIRGAVTGGIQSGSRDALGWLQSVAVP